MNVRNLTAAVLVVLFAFAPVAKAGRIVVANDDWTLSDTGFAKSSDAGTFALNVADWFTGGGPGHFLVYSNHFGLTDQMITDTMTNAGHTWDHNMSVSFDVDTLLTYDGVFTGGFPKEPYYGQWPEWPEWPDNQVLIDYVNAGGNIYVYSAGNSYDPLIWNTFLESFGLRIYGFLALDGSISINSPHAIFAGVHSLYTLNGSYIEDLAPEDPHNQVLAEYLGAGAYAVYDGQLDDQGPVTWNVVANPNPVAVGGSVTLTANVDDTSSGSSIIALAEYSLDAGAWTPMSAQDGDFDGVSEDVVAAFTAPLTPGVYDLRVIGTDAVPNVGPSSSILFVVYDPEGGFVTGGGWIDSPLGAYALDPSLSGKANFGFVSKYKKGATTPTGQTEFVFQAGDLNFHSSSYDWLVVNQAGTNAQFKGSGTINGTGDYRFMLWAGDGGKNDYDTFRIRIWEEDDAGNEFVVYDNGTEQSISGGSIVIHTK